MLFSLYYDLNRDGAAGASGGDGVEVDDVDVAFAASGEDDDVAVGEGVGGHGDEALGILLRLVTKQLARVVGKGKHVDPVHQHRDQTLFLN